MFEVFKEQNKRIQALKQSRIIKSSLSSPQLQSVIIDLNINQMYEKGMDAEGHSLGQYAISTIYGTSRFEGKIAKGQRIDHITLKDTGAYYKSLKFRNESDGFKITGDGAKEGGDLSDRWPDALGLTEESLQETINYVREDFTESVRGAL